MNVCIVKEDKVVMIDGEAINFDFDLPSNVWAIQWNGSTGEIEFTDGNPNESITDFSAYQSLVDGHATEKQRLADVAVQEEADRIANMTYADKRAEAYPTQNEQNDMAYWDRQNGTTTLDDAIKAVKDAYPKPTA
jgi:hypothetical protein